MVHEEDMHTGMISRCYHVQFWLRHTQLEDILVLADMMFGKPP